MTLTHDAAEKIERIQAGAEDISSRMIEIKSSTAERAAATNDMACSG